jgi:dienelactone hydrolase
MSHDLPQAQLSALWKQLVARAGPFVRVTATTVTPETGGYHLITMTCSFTRAAHDDAVVVLDTAGRIAGLFFGPQPTDVVTGWQAPSYADTARFHEVPVTVVNGPWHLPGTLTVPNGPGPFATVVLVPGSPPLDQDATVDPNKMFKDLAWGLASRGIAVLRYTKRTHQFGAGLGDGNVSMFTIKEELTDDAHAAIALAAGRSEVDRRRIYLLGHSLGGYAAPLIAAGDPRIAGVVVTGAPSGDLLTVLLQRLEAGAARGGEEGAQASSMIPAIKKLRDSTTAPGGLVEMFGQRTPVGYWADLREYEAGAASANLHAPVLVMVGGHDAEVPPDDFDGWKRALAGKANATVKFYAQLFHLFMPSSAHQRGTDTTEDWTRPSHVAPEVVADIASWILSNP